MTRSPLSSLRVRLVLLVLLAVLPALALILYTAAEQRRDAAANVKREALGLAQLAAADQQEAIESMRQLLVALGHLPAVRTRDSAACSALFADFLKQYPRYANLGVAEPDGAVSCSGLPLSGPVNLADRAYIRRALETREFAVGEYQIGRITGKASVNLGYPISDDAGRVQAVVFSALDLAWLNQLAATASLPEGSTLTVVDSAGTILVQYPDPEPWVGKAVPEAPIVRVILSRQGNGTAEAAGPDGTRRLYAFTPVGGPESGVYVTVGIPDRVAFADANRLLARNLAGLGLAAVLALAAAWLGGSVFLLRPVTALVNATKWLTVGDMRARTGLAYGLGELDQLARAFDEMAEVLQTRQTEAEQVALALTSERERADAELQRLRQQFELVLASADEGIHGLDREGKATFINSAAASMTGYSVEELLGQRLHEILHHTKADGTPYSWEECPACATLRDGVVRRAADQVFWRKDGSRLPVEYVSAPLREDGAIVGAVVLFRPAPSAGRRSRRSHE